MREILFRGKTLDNGEWVYGSLFGKRHIAVEIREGEEPVSSFGVATYRWVEVIPETVGQYTGRDDKNGVKVFGGDIVAFLGIRWDGPDGDRVDYVGIVRYSDEHTSFNFEISNGLQATTFDADDVKVIGNIHDNPVRR